MSNTLKTKEYFLKAVSSALDGTVLNAVPDDIDLNILYKLSVQHSSQVLLYFALKDTSLKDTELFKRLEKSYKVNAIREMTQQAEMAAIKKEFSENGIEFMLLKGSHLKALYPVAEMRFMVDIDVLVKKEQIEKAKQIILSHGFNLKNNNGKDIVFIKEPFLTIELHNTLFVEEYYMYDYFLSTWERAERVTDYEYKMSLNDLYVYTLAHLAEHYTSAGACFRPCMDIYLLNKEFKDTLDFDYINKEFEKLSIRKFADNINSLTKCMFEGEKAEGELKTMENFILLGPPKDINNVSANPLNDMGSKKKLIFSSLFPSLKKMKLNFPILEKLPILLPIFWIIRLVKKLFNKDAHSKLERIKDANTEDFEIMKKIYKDSGIEKL